MYLAPYYKVARHCFPVSFAVFCTDAPTTHAHFPSYMVESIAWYPNLLGQLLNLQLPVPQVRIGAPNGTPGLSCSLCFVPAEILDTQ